MMDVWLKRALGLQWQRMVISHDGSDMLNTDYVHWVVVEFEQQKMPAQHEHELESQHPMTPGSLRRESCRYERTRVSGPRKLVSAEIEHFKTPACEFPDFKTADSH
jgi:hypothetical protein